MGPFKELRQTVKKTPPLIGPFKGINKKYKRISPKFHIDIRVLKPRFWVFSRGPGGFRELQKAGRNHFHLSWYLSVPVVTSYGQKPRGGGFVYRLRYIGLYTAKKMDCIGIFSLTCTVQMQELSMLDLQFEFCAKKTLMLKFRGLKSRVQVNM